MGLSELIKSIVQMLKLSKKSGRDEYLLYLKLTLLGLAAVGVIGFIIKLISSVIKLYF
ncbi:MAG: protein translocase SEC61 complex subunit gamma [Nitrososphaerales archaeon]